MSEADNPDKVPFLDPDLSAMQMDELEKWRVQSYRNFSRSIDRHREKQFVEKADSMPISVDKLAQVLRHVVSEDSRSLPVIFCAFADEQLLEMFRREIPTDVPGGRGELLNGFGPLSRLAQRIQIAYAFGWLSPDILLELNLIRKLRNEISHKWDIETLQEELQGLIGQKQYRVEEELANSPLLPKNWVDDLTPMSKFRVRLVWCLSRVFYEAEVAPFV